MCRHGLAKSLCQVSLGFVAPSKGDIQDGWIAAHQTCLLGNVLLGGAGNADTGVTPNDGDRGGINGRFTDRPKFLVSFGFDER